MHNAGTFCRPPEQGDVLISEGSHAATGTFDVVIKHPITKQLVLFPLLFIDRNDLDLTKSISRVSSKPVPDSCSPVGKLTCGWTLTLY